MSKNLRSDRVRFQKVAELVPDRPGGAIFTVQGIGESVRDCYRRWKELCNRR